MVTIVRTYIHDPLFPRHHDAPSPNLPAKQAHRAHALSSPPRHAAAAAAEGALRGAGGQGFAGGLGLSGLLVADGFVDAEDEAGGLDGGLDGVDLDEGGFPDEGVHHIGDALVVAGGEVDAGPDAALAVLDAQLVEDVGGVEARVVAQLARDHLERLRERLDHRLLLVGDVLVGELVQVGGDLHLAGAAAADDQVVLDGALDDHDGVVQGALDFGDELLGAAAQDQGAGLGLGAVLEEVEALAADLALVEGPAHAEVVGLDVGAGGLDGGAGGLDDAVHVLGGDAAGAEDVAVGEVLGGEVADGLLGQDDLGAGGVQGLELLVDDLPLGVDDGLVLGDLFDADLGVVLLGLELELDVEAHDLGLLEGLGLLLEAGVGEGLLEGDAVDEEGFGQGAAGDFLDADEFLVEVVLVEGENGVDNHCCWGEMSR